MSARNSPNLRRWGKEWGEPLDMARRWKIECFEFTTEGSCVVCVALCQRVVHFGRWCSIALWWLHIEIHTQLFMRDRETAVARLSHRNSVWSSICLSARDVVSVETSRDVLTSRLGLGAICLGLGPAGLVSGLGPLSLVETFCAGACRAYCSCI